MKLRLYLILLLLLPLLSFTAHKYYISLCEIEYVQEQKSIQMILNLFVDDLEFTLNQEHQIEMQLDTDREISNSDELLEAYLQNHFVVKVNGKETAYNYIGKEYDDNLARFYLEITDVAQLDQIEISNSSLIKYFPDQQNIIKIKIVDFHKTCYLNRKNANCLLNF